MAPARIYNSRNYSILLNINGNGVEVESTTVEIILYYLTFDRWMNVYKSTTVEIILYYLTLDDSFTTHESTTVEIILYYLTHLTKE